MTIQFEEAVLAPDPLGKPTRISLADNIADLIATRHITSGVRIVETSLAERQGILAGRGHRGYHAASFQPEVTQQVLFSCRAGRPHFVDRTQQKAEEDLVSRFEKFVSSWPFPF